MKSLLFLFRNKLILILILILTTLVMCLGLNPGTPNRVSITDSSHWFVSMVATNLLYFTRFSKEPFVKVCVNTGCKRPAVDRKRALIFLFSSGLQTSIALVNPVKRAVSSLLVKLTSPI